MHCINSLSFVAQGKLQASVIDLLLLGVAAAWRRGFRGAPPRRLLRSPDFGCERFVLTSPVWWRATLVESRCGAVPWFKSAQDQEVLDRGAVDSWDPPQRGLGVTGKSSTPQEKILVSSLVTSLAHFDYCIYFENFILLELELYLVILGCKPKLEIVVVWHRVLLCY